MQFCDRKRVFVSSEYGYGSMDDVLRKSFSAEVGLSFKAFKRLLGYLSAVKFLQEKRDLQDPLSRFTAFLYELCMVNLTCFREKIMSHNFDADLELKPGKRDSRKASQKYVQKFKAKNFNYTRSRDLEEKLLIDLSYLSRIDADQSQ